MLHLSFTYETLIYFLLIFARITGFVSIAPLTGGVNTGVTNSVKIAFSFLVSILLLPVVPLTTLEYHTTIAYAFIVIKEAVCGIILGFAAQICMQVTGVAGQIVDMMVGLSMSTVMDPSSGENVTITSTLYNKIILVMMIVSGMYRYLISAVADSYKWIPINGVVLREDSFAVVITEFVKDFFIIGFRVALPVFIVTFIVNIILGILAKVAPQLNMFSVGLQIKILVGFIIMFISCSMLGSASEFIMTSMRTLMESFIGAMKP